MYTELKNRIERAWEDATLLHEPEILDTIEQVVALLDKGELRVAEPKEDGTWQVNEWVKQAVMLYFPSHELTTSDAGDLDFYDKLPL